MVLREQLYIGRMLFLGVILCLVFSKLQAQDNPPINSIRLELLSPLNFSYTNAQDLLEKKVIPNAFALSIKIKNENVIVSALVNVFSNSGNTDVAKLLALRMTNKSSPNVSISNSEVALSNDMVPLFFQPKSLSGVKHYAFYYDVILNPPKTIIPPGTYSFSIDFTITPQ